MLAYLGGLVSAGDVKSVEPIALEMVGGQSVRSLQMVMKNYRWDHQRMAAQHRQRLAPLIGEPEGMICLDSSEFGKKGRESVGVARQYCGELGKLENCQPGVFVGYSGSKSYDLLAAHRKRRLVALANVR